MATELYGGSLDDDATAYAESMASEIEKALDEVRIEAGLGPVPKPADPEEVTEDLKNRRILFIAIARGVIRHLANKEQAFEIDVQVGSHPTVTTHPDIQVKPP